MWERGTGVMAFVAEQEFCPPLAPGGFEVPALVLCEESEVRDSKRDFPGQDEGKGNDGKEN